MATKDYRLADAAERLTALVEKELEGVTEKERESRMTAFHDVVAKVRDTHAKSEAQTRTLRTRRANQERA